jgi:hypothetical protein
MTIVIDSADRWLLPDGTLVGYTDRFVIDDWQYQNGVSGLSEEQIKQLGIVKMSAKPDERYGTASPDRSRPGAWVIAPVPQATLRSSLKEYAAQKRWAVETGGVVVNGVRVVTDDAAQRKISELSRRVDGGKIALPFDFKSQSGWVKLNKAAINSIDEAVAKHVQACYAIEKAVSEEIDAGTISTFEQIDIKFSAYTPDFKIPPS